MQPVKLLQMLYLHQKRIALFLATNMFWLKKGKEKKATAIKPNSCAQQSCQAASP